jgi:hypothetical protein
MGYDVVICSHGFLRNRFTDRAAYEAYLVVANLHGIEAANKKFPHQKQRTRLAMHLHSVGEDRKPFMVVSRYMDLC